MESMILFHLPFLRFSHPATWTIPSSSVVGCLSVVAESSEEVVGGITLLVSTVAIILIG